jgi:hypothetical protein
MLRNKALAIAVAVLAAPAMAQTTMSQQEKLAIVGATLIDVSGFGRSTNDVGDSVVLIDDGKITVAGPASQVPIPSGTRRIDAHGKFLIPVSLMGSAPCAPRLLAMLISMTASPPFTSPQCCRMVAETAS